jgi:hypothetical protein
MIMLIRFNKIITPSLLFIFICLKSDGQRLDRFGSANRISYNKISSYFGYADSLNKPDETRKDTGYYFMYFWLNDSVAETGVRLISPVPDVVMPDRGDLVSDNYYENEKDKTNYFDTWISLERTPEIVAKENIPGFKTAAWVQLGFNDDSSELFPQPSGNLYNSLLRIKKLPAGLYRVRFTSYKKGKVRGSYLLQVGITTALPFLKLVKNPEELKD